MKHNILFTLFVVFVVVGGAFVGCTDYTDDIQAPQGGQDNLVQGGNNVLPPHLQKPNDGEFSEEKMLVNIGLNVILKNADEFYLETRRLKRDISDRCAKLQSGVQEQSHLVRVQEQWKKTMLAYHRLDAIPIGPLADQKIANNIYSWPTVNFCGIDLEVARLAKGTGEDSLPINKKGLGALEYLLYSASNKTACPNSFLNKDAVEWVAKTETEKNVDRCLFEEKIIGDLEERAKELYSAWDVSQKNYSKTLIDKSQYATTKAAINAMTDALFSVEVIKDTKLGLPLGIIKGCEDPSGKCPQFAEHELSGLALESIEAQLVTFKEAFFGSVSPKTKAFGFDDYLISKGHSELVEEFDRKIKTVETSVLGDQAKGVIQDLIIATDKASCVLDSPSLSQQPACQLFFDVRELTLLLKVEFLTVLSLEAPATFQGDND